MSSNQQEGNSKIQLPMAVAVGFTGHRRLPDEARSRAAIYDLLARKKSGSPDTLYGVSSVAAGGDLLFAESCLALDIPVRVLLPMSREEFRQDFDLPTWTRAEAVMRRAISVETIGNDGPRDERYYECGLETVLQSQCLIALWNGEPAAGRGGTEEIVTFARQMGRPVDWIHSVTGSLTSYDEKSVRRIDGNAELKFLNHLPDAGASTTASLPAAWLAKLDANAVLVAPQVRRLAALPIVCTALAAFVSGEASRRHGAALWGGAGAVLGLAAALLPAALRLGKRQALWVRIRTAAEVSRSFLALWDTPAHYQVVGSEILPELSGMIRALNFLKPPIHAREIGVDEFKKKYLNDRLIDQRKYFHKQSTKAALSAKRYRLVSKVCSVVAILISAWMFGGPYVLKLHGGAVALGGSTRPLPLIASALFQIATIAGALVVVHDCDRRQRRYREIHDALAEWEVELHAFHTWPPVTEVVNKIERALLVELLEWRSLLQNMKMPRN